MANNLSVDQVQENFCEATNILIKKQLESLQFDVTIEATIVDTSKAALGAYSVSTGQSTFTAYSSSDTKYKKDDKVMITIPQGNYDNQKIIIGKSVNNEDNSTVVYKPPFENLINISGNLCSSDDKELGLIANNNDETEYLWSTNEELVTFINNIKFLNQKPFWDSDDISEESYINYDYIGMKADFLTQLNAYNAISGNYGLILEVEYQNNDRDNNNGTEKLIQLFNFDSSEFFGNIYNSNFYHTQEKVFDISLYKDYLITRIKLYAYQRSNFKDSKNNLIYPYEESLKEGFEFNKPNIWIKNPYVCLGISSSTFNQDTIKIITKDKTNYYKNHTSTSEEQRFAANKKTLNLQWIHKNDKTNLIYKVMPDNIPQDYSIRWYRYKLGAPTPDQYMGTHWSRFYGCSTTPNENGDYCVLNSDNDEATDKIKNISFYPNVNNQSEKIRAVVINKKSSQVAAVSPIIEFLNDDEISNDTTIIDTNALAIKYEDGTQGNYFIYNRAGTILDSNDMEVKKLTILFGEDRNVNNKEQLSYNKNSYNYIKWVIPEEGSMIKPLQPDTLQPLKKPSLNSSSNEIFNDGQGNTIVYNENSKSFEFKFELGEEENPDLEKFTQISYLIDQNLDYGKSRNSVFLEARIDGKLYSASTTMLFGPSGTSGSEYTIVINWDNGKSVFDINNDRENGISGSAELRLNGKVVDISSSGAEYNYTWYGPKVDNNKTPRLDINAGGENNSAFTITMQIDEENSNINDIFQQGYILQVSLTGFGDYNLVACYPIALKQNTNNCVVNNIEGPTTVRYACDGTVNFDKNPYIIHITQSNGNNVNTNCSWEMNTFSKESIFEESNINILSLSETDSSGSSEADSYIKPILKPLSFYVKTDSSIYSVQCYLEKDLEKICIWSQPIYIYQDNYPSGTINKWDGSLTLDDDAGIVMARGFSAGKKNDENKFSGVMLGDWSPTGETDIAISGQTGIYGFLNGAMSYAFKEDGTAFLGRASAGQIKFDGNGGIIKSGNFNIPSEEYPYGQGSQIDLQNGSMLLFGNINPLDEQYLQYKDFYSLTLNTNLENTLPLFQIGRTRNVNNLIASKFINDYLGNLDQLKFLAEEYYNNIVPMVKFFNNIKKVNEFFESTSNGENIDELPDNLDVNYIISGDERKTLKDYSTEIYFSNLIKELYEILIKELYKNENEKIISSGDWEFNESEKIETWDNDNFKLNYIKINSCCFYLDQIKDKYINNLWDNYINSESLVEDDEFTCLFFNNLLALKIIKDIRKKDYDFIAKGDNNNSRGEYDYKIENIAEEAFKTKTVDDVCLDDDTPWPYKYLYKKSSSDFKEEVLLSITRDKQKIVLIKDETLFMPNPGQSASNQTQYPQGYYLRYGKNSNNFDSYDFSEYRFDSSDTEYIYKIENILFPEDVWGSDNNNNKIIVIQIIYSDGTDNGIEVKFEQTISKTDIPNSPINIIFYANGGAPIPHWSSNNEEQKAQCVIEKITDINDLRGFYKIKKILEKNFYDAHSFIFKNSADEISYGSIFSPSKFKQLFGCKPLDNNDLFHKFSGSHVWTAAQELKTQMLQYKESVNKINKAIKEYDDLHSEADLPKTKEATFIYQTLFFYPPDQPDRNISTTTITLFPNLTNFNDFIGDSSPYRAVFESYIFEDNTIIDIGVWENNLLRIDKNGGYMTSYHYRPTMEFFERQPRLPTDSQAAEGDSQGMKGFIIDFTNDKFILGNNSAIEGYQTQYYKGQRTTSGRSFKISTGAEFQDFESRKRDVLKPSSANNQTYFIEARAGMMSNTFALPPIFTVQWNGDVYIRGNLTVGGGITQRV